jgi:hypothetical protein
MTNLPLKLQNQNVQLKRVNFSTTSCRFIGASVTEFAHQTENGPVTSYPKDTEGAASHKRGAEAGGLDGNAHLGRNWAQREHALVGELEGIERAARGEAPQPNNGFCKQDVLW